MIGCFDPSEGYSNPVGVARRIAALTGDGGKPLLATGMGKKAIFGAFDALPKDHPTAPFWGAVRAALENPPAETTGGLGLGDIPLPNGKVSKASLRDALLDTEPKVAKKVAKKATKKTAKKGKIDRSAPVYRAAHQMARAVQAASGGSSAAYKAAYNQALVAAGFPPYYA